MAEEQPTDWSRWTEREHPWDVQGRDLTTAEMEELDLYYKQEKFLKVDEEEQKKFDEEIRRITKEFNESKRKRHNDIQYPFVHQVTSDGIEKTRNRFAPAYTFTRFIELPPELQLRIWSFAIRSEAPKTHLFTDLDSKFDSYFAKRNKLKRSSRIQRAHEYGSKELLVPRVLHICQQSRLEALKTFTLLPCSAGCAPNEYEAHFNTYDNFYLGGKSWTEFKILVDLLIRLNTTRPLRESLQRDLDKFTKSIRFLTVDVTIFGSLPIQIWAEFTKLEVLTIAVYPWSDIDYTFVYKKCGSRAKLIHKSASDSFNTLQRDRPQWKAPKIEVVARKTGSKLDEDENERDHDGGANLVVEGGLDEYDGDDPVSDEAGDGSETDPTPDEEEEEDNDYELEEDDGEYLLEQLPGVMSHQAWKLEIKEMKHTYHPSRKIAKRPYWMSEGWEDDLRAKFPKYAVTHPKGRLEERYGEVLTDSETESGGRETAVVWSGNEDDSD